MVGNVLMKPGFGMEPTGAPLLSCARELSQRETSQSQGFSAPWRNLLLCVGLQLLVLSRLGEAKIRSNCFQRLRKSVV